MVNVNGCTRQMEIFNQVLVVIQDADAMPSYHGIIIHKDRVIVSRADQGRIVAYFKRPEDAKNTQATKLYATQYVVRIPITSQTGLSAVKPE